MQRLILILADGLGFFIHLFQLLLLVNWVLWLVSADPYNPLVRGLRWLIEPVLSWLRRSLPWLVQGAWDLSPIAALLICAFLKKAIVFQLHLLAARF